MCENLHPIVLRVQELLAEGTRAKKAYAIVASEFDTTPAAVRGRHQRSGGDTTKSHGLRLLTKDQEEVMLLLSIGFSAANLGLTNSLLRQLGWILWQKKLDRKWCLRWRLQHKEDLAPRRSKYLKNERADPSILDHIEAFIGVVELHRSKFDMRPHLVLNYDETIVTISTAGQIVLEKRDKERANTLVPSSTTLGSLLTFVCADGSVFVSFWIVKGKFDGDGTGTVLFTLPSQKYPQRHSWDRFWTSTDTGYLSTPTFHGCLVKFVELWRLHRPGLKCWLFGDQLSSHKQLEILKYALEKGVEMWFLPTNTSHFLQPLDDKPFANFKKIMKAHAYEAAFAAQLSGEILRETFFSLAYQAETQAFTQRAIQVGFRETGLHPWDPSRIRAKARASQNTELTPEEEQKIRCVAAVKEVIDHQIQTARVLRGQVTSHRVPVTKHTVFSPQDIIALIEKQKAEREKIELEKWEEIITNTCQNLECGVVRRGGVNWGECPQCAFVVCPKHKADLISHEQYCCQ